MKRTTFNRLQRGQSVRVSARLEPTWFEPVASERKVVQCQKGQPVHRFDHMVGNRVEALDSLAYTFAARSAAPM